MENEDLMVTKLGHGKRFNPYYMSLSTKLNIKQLDFLVGDNSQK